MTERIILAIDPGTRVLGWAMKDKWGTFVIDGHRPQRFSNMFNRIYEFMARVRAPAAYPDRPELVVVHYRPFARGDDATRCGWGMAALIEVAATMNSAAVIDVPEITVRKYHGAPVKADRETLKRWSLQKAWDLGYNVQDHDTSDAVLLLTYAERNISA